MLSKIFQEIKQYGKRGILWGIFVKTTHLAYFLGKRNICNEQIGWVQKIIPKNMHEREEIFEFLIRRIYLDFITPGTYALCFVLNAIRRSQIIVIWRLQNNLCFFKFFVIICDGRNRHDSTRKKHLKHIFQEQNLKNIRTTYLNLEYSYNTSKMYLLRLRSSVLPFLIRF